MTAYVADRDAAEFSRPAQAGLISDLGHSADVGRVFVVGLSMGRPLTMENLLHLRLQGRSVVLNHIELVLADPDIGLDLF